MSNSCISDGVRKPQSARKSVRAMDISGLWFGSLYKSGRLACNRSACSYLGILHHYLETQAKSNAYFSLLFSIIYLLFVQISFIFMPILCVNDCNTRVESNKSSKPVEYDDKRL